MALFRRRLPRIRPAALDRTGINWLLGSAALVLAAHAWRLPVWLALLTAALVLWSLVINNRGWRHPPGWLRIALTLLLALLVLRNYGTLFGRDAGTGFLSLLLGLKLLELRRGRDALVAIFLCYFLMLVQFLFSQALWVAAYTVLVALVAGIAMYRVSQPGSATLSDSIRLPAGLIVKALPLALILFVFFPRIQGSLWLLPSAGDSGISGLSEELSPGSLNRLSLSAEVAFRVEFDGPPPPPAQRYWRAMVMDTTDGNGWAVSKKEVPQRENFTAVGPAVSYTVTLEPHGRNWLFALDLPAVAPQSARIAPGFVLRSAEPVRSRIRYRAGSYPGYRTGPLSDAARDRYLALPRTFSPRTRLLADGWRTRLGDRHDQVVNAALDYFRDNDFYYTLAPPPLSGDMVGQFLFETRRGYCEHYAGAFTGLMRAAGIPARVVTGYQGGELNPQGGYFIISQGDAHAWSEVWMAGRGWVRVDPTAAVAPERIEFGAEAVRQLLTRGAPLGQLAPPEVLRAIQDGLPARALRQLRLSWDRMNQAWNNWVLQFDAGRQADMMRWLGFENPGWRQLAGVLLAGVTLMLAVLAIWTLWQRAPTDPVQAAWLRFCRRLARAGVQRSTAEGPLDLTRRAARSLPRDREAITRIGQLYIGLRYGNLASPLVQELRSRVSRFRPRVPGHG